MLRLGWLLLIILPYFRIFLIIIFLRWRVSRSYKLSLFFVNYLLGFGSLFEVSFLVPIWCPTEIGLPRFSTWLIYLMVFFRILPYFLTHSLVILASLCIRLIILVILLPLLQIFPWFGVCGVLFAELFLTGNDFSCRQWGLVKWFGSSCPLFPPAFTSALTRSVPVNRDLSRGFL